MRNLFHSPESQRISVLDQRFYSNDGINFYPGSTTILECFPKGSWFTKWLKEQGEDADKIRDLAGESGSRVHDATERLDKGEQVSWADENGKPNFTLEEWQMLLNYLDFTKKVTPKIIANEQKLCSDVLKYGGTLDRIVEFGGKRWVLDIKTSNQMADTYIMQLASYAMLWNERFPETTVDDICILWLKAQIKTDKIDDHKEVWQGKPNDARGWQVVTFKENYQSAFEDFKHVQAIFNRSNPNYKPLNLIYPDRISIGNAIQFPVIADTVWIEE